MFKQPRSKLSKVALKVREVPQAVLNLNPGHFNDGKENRALGMSQHGKGRQA